MECWLGFKLSASFSDLWTEDGNVVILSVFCGYTFGFAEHTVTVYPMCP
jgi:hypothetical protein